MKIFRRMTDVSAWQVFGAIVQVTVAAAFVFAFVHQGNTSFGA